MRLKISIDAVVGLICLFVWVATFQIPERPVFRSITAFSTTGDEQQLLLAAITLLVFNTVRAVPLYLGCLYVGETGGRYGRILPLFMIPLSYSLIEFFAEGRGHHFGMAAVMGIAIVLFLQIFTRNVKGRFNRSIALSLFVFSFQWLNMPPFMTPYGFGQGELSLTIKYLAELSNLSYVLDFLGLGGFVVAFIGALMAVALMVNIELNARQFQRLMTQNATLAAMREDAIRARMVLEIQSLVHDLRRPLTSIQGLADVLAVLSKEPEARGYAERIGADAAGMDHMIGEILHGNVRSSIDVGELMDYAMSQASPFPWHRYVHVERNELPRFSGNRILISRALVNLLENAANAVEGRENPYIAIKCSVEGKMVKFTVRDNGPGVPEELPVGYSGHGSTGLGLAVIHNVAENHGGSFTLKNHPDGGAEAALCLPLEDTAE